MDRLDRYFGVHGKALSLRSERMQILASNIANAATPGFKARDLSFGDALSDVPSNKRMALVATNAGHMGMQSASEAELLYRKPVQASLDGNTVELATEQLQFTETAVRYRSSLSMLNGRIEGIMTALKAE